jgi:predicted nuclease with TOPRIM domain
MFEEGSAHAGTTCRSSSFGPAKGQSIQHLQVRGEAVLDVFVLLFFSPFLTSQTNRTAYSSDSESDQDKKVEHVTKHRPLTRLSKAEPEDRSATAPFARDAIRKKSESLAVPTDKESESLWRTKYQQLQEQHEETQKKLKELQYTNLYITKELKETREAAEKAQERNRNTLEKLRSKLESLEGGVNQKNQEAVIEVERENKKLQSEITKLKLGTKKRGEQQIFLPFFFCFFSLPVTCCITELDRAKDTDGLIPHYRLAIMKVKAQTTALREKLEQLNEEKTALKQEMVQQPPPRPTTSFSQKKKDSEMSWLRRMFTKRLAKKRKRKRKPSDCNCRNWKRCERTN